MGHPPFRPQVRSLHLQNTPWRAIAIVCLLAWGCAWPTAHAQAAGIEVFGLTSHAPKYTPDGDEKYWPNLIYRELVRQSVLTTARDEFGLATRDQVLREPLPDAGSPEHFDIQVDHVQGSRVEYKLSHKGAVIYEETAHFFFGQRDSTWAVLRPLHEQARGPLIDALTKAGLKHNPLPVNLDGGGVTPDISEALSQMDAVSQYTAVRLAHQAMREHGQTRDLLVVLARGYANLGQMTIFHHSAMRYAFTARGLIYADRLIRLDPESPTGHWARGYVSGMLGYQQQSLWDFSFADDRVKNLDQAQNDPLQMPEWAKAIDLANHYWHDSLMDWAVKEGPYQELTTFLWYRSTEFVGNERMNIETGRKVLEKIPGCMRIHEGINRVAGVRWGHRCTQENAIRWSQTLPQALRRATTRCHSLARVLRNDLDRCQDVVGRHAYAMDLIRWADTGQDLHEPSAAVLGAIIDEQNVMQIDFRARFLRDKISIDTTEYLDSVAQALQGHPQEKLIMTLKLRRRSGIEAYEKALQGYGYAEGSMAFTRNGLLSRLPAAVKLADGRTRHDLLTQLHFNCGVAEPEYSFKMLYGDSDSKLQYAKWSAGILPYSPLRFTTLINYDWDNVRQHADAWEEEYGHHPVVAEALATQYEKEEDPQRALKLYEKYKWSCPDYGAYYMLAAIHWRVLDDKDKALDYVYEFLEQEDYALEHANIARAVAYSYMAEGDYKKALPWAQRAARSGALWAIGCEGYCYEHLGRVNDAMANWKRTERRYNSKAEVSAAFRLKLGSDKAWALAETYVRKHHPDKVQQELRYQAATHAALYGTPQEAAQAYETLIKHDNRPFHHIMAGYFSGIQGDQDKLMQHLTAATEHDPDKGHPNLREGNTVTRDVARLMLAGLQQGELDTEALKEMAGFPRDFQYPNIIGFTAMSLELMDPDSKEAAELWAEVASSVYRYRAMPLLGMRKLRDRGIEPMDQPVQWRGFRVNTDPEYLDR